MKDSYRRNITDSYGYASGLAKRVSYSLSMQKVYGIGIDLNSYLGIGRKGLAGYVNSHNSGLQAVYSAQNQPDFYKKTNGKVDYNSRFRKEDHLEYDLPSRRRPVLSLEHMMN